MKNRNKWLRIPEHIEKERVYREAVALFDQLEKKNGVLSTSVATLRDRLKKSFKG